MAAPFEGGLQPSLHHLVLEFLPEHLGRQAEDVEIVVTPTHFGCHQVVAGGRADAMHLVGGDRHADAGAAQEHATVNRPLTHAMRDVCGDVGIVDGIGPVTAAVDDLMADPFEQPDEPQPCRDAPMVTANGGLEAASPMSVLP